MAAKNVNLSDFECSQKVVRWGLGWDFFCFLFTFADQKAAQKCFGKMPWGITEKY